jgi:hypothetical protein
MAIAEVLARHSEAQIKELELRAKQQSVVSVDIHPAITRSSNGDGYLIHRRRRACQSRQPKYQNQLER